MSQTKQMPEAGPRTGLKVLRRLAGERSLLAALEVMREEVGPAFQITLPGFEPAVFVGPESNRQIMVSRRERFQWRNPSDPVTKLLRHGLLVEDGEQHACLRAQMAPLMQRSQVGAHVPAMQAYTDRVLADWDEGSVQDMLVEMRRVALLIFMGTLLDVDFEADMGRMWQPILRAIKYISPGLWILWPDAPRFGYEEALGALDAYLYGLIAERRSDLPNRCTVGSDLPNRCTEGSDLPNRCTEGRSDLLSHLVGATEMSDDLVRDQVLTMLIAGHDTSTALLAWALHLLARHEDVLARAQREVDAVMGEGPIDAEALNDLYFLDAVIKETLRLYPPIHVSNRIIVEDSDIAGYELQAGTRVMASIYLSHRDERYWDEATAFRPERFERGSDSGQAAPGKAFTYVPFGGGPRNCIGAAFAQIEAKVVLARILQQFTLEDVGRAVRPYMGATLEPHPGVFLRVRRRRS